MYRCTLSGVSTTVHQLHRCTHSRVSATLHLFQIECYGIPTPDCVCWRLGFDMAILMVCEYPLRVAIDKALDKAYST